MKTLISTFLSHVALQMKVPPTKIEDDQKKIIDKFLLNTQKIYDERVHALADQLEISKNLVEEYIYSLAKDHLKRHKKAEAEPPADPSLKGFVTDIEKDTVDNKNFRKVLYTGKNSQLVLMSLNANEDIGDEVHTVDQFFRIDGGDGKVIINDKEQPIKNGSAFVIPAGVKHNVVAGKSGLKLYSIYSPPQHKDAVLHKTKEDAQKDKEHFDGTTSEQTKKEAAADSNKINRAVTTMPRDTISMPKNVFKGVRKIDPKLMTEVKRYISNPTSLGGRQIKDLDVAIALSAMAQNITMPSAGDVQKWAVLTKIPVLETDIRDSLVEHFPKFFE